MPENTASLLSRPCGSRPRLTALQAVQAAQAGRSPAATAFGAGQAAPGLRPLRPALRLALRMTIERVALRRQRHGLRPGGMAAPGAGTPVGDLPAFPGALRAGVVVAPLAPSVGHLRALPDDPGARPVLRARNSLLHDEKPAMSPRRLRPRRALLVCLALAGGALLASTAPAADAWPAKPIQLVIPYPPGGSADLLGRPLAAQLQQQLGQPVVLEYKPGAGGTLASHYVARAKPDGYTLLMVLAAHAINDSLYPKLPYDTRKDFVPVSLLANLPMVVAASSKLRARNIQELIQAAKAAPGQLSFGSAGNGNTGHLAAEYFSSLCAIEMTHVPYKGSAGVVNAMLAGDIDLTFDSISTSMPHIRSGRMHALAVTSAERSALAPEVKTVQEQGVAGFDVTGWYALIAPAGTPADITQRLSRAIASALRQPPLQAQLAAGGYEPVGSTPEALQAHLEREITRWAAVVKATGARVD